MATSCLWGRLEQPPSGLEYARRLDIFARNLAQAQQLEAEDLGTAEFGVTPFSDLTGTGHFQDPRWWWGGSRGFSRDPGRWTGQTFSFHFPERGTLRTRGLVACPESQKAGVGLGPSPAQG